MHGIVSLLDDQHYQLVEDLWAELKREFAVEGVYITPYPHFSYQVATDYDVEELEAILRGFAADHTAFQVQTAGLGIFTGPQPVLYIPVVRSPELTEFHQALWQRISRVGDGIQAYYHPDQWMPHITIGFGDISSKKLSQIVRYLGGRDFHWEVTVDNLALIYDNGTRQVLKVRYELGTGRRYRPVTLETLQRIHQIRERLIEETGGHVFEDSAELIHQMREERTRELEQAISGDCVESRQPMIPEEIEALDQLHEQIIQKRKRKQAQQ